MDLAKLTSVVGIECKHQKNRNVCVGMHLLGVLVRASKVSASASGLVAVSQNCIETVQNGFPGT